MAIYGDKLVRTVSNVEVAYDVVIDHVPERGFNQGKGIIYVDRIINGRTCGYDHFRDVLCQQKGSRV